MLNLRVLSLLIFLINFNVSNLEICSRVVNYHDKVRVPETFLVTKTYKTYSGVQKSITRNETRFVVKTVVKTRMRKGCCPGYVRKEHRCEPFCNFVCENSVCTAPDVCTCNAGYKLFTLTRCIPECENCNHGVCIAPGVCQCLSNYQKSENGTCEPICENGCINGYCSAPNICSCNEGYYLIDENNPNITKCKPHCSKECYNGYCSGPEQCSCRNGYKMNDVLQMCEPFCSNGCENGICLGPDECFCMPYYVYNILNGACEPTCIDNYKLNILGEKELCCHEGFQLTESGVCEPYCSNCTNGVCHGPEHCICNAGYELKQNHCEPVCREGCVNGFCVAPDTCQCLENYTNNDTGICIPYCDPSCINGDCLQPMKCTCKDGFEKDYLNSHVCNAKCDNCGYGECIGPNVCECYNDYEFNDILKTCQYNGIFYENDIIATPYDFYWDSHYSTEMIQFSENMFPTENTPEPKNDIDYDDVTSNLDYDSTISNEYDFDTFTNENLNHLTTDVFDYESSIISFENDSSSTTTENELTTTEDDENICNLACKNGVCVNGECECMKGYILNNDNICNPKCSYECINSFCVAPDTCICWDGYSTLIQNSSHCLPMCNLEIYGCKNGNCILPNICECHENYDLNPNNKFECLKNEPDRISLNAKNSENLIILPYIIILIIFMVVLIVAIYYKKYYQTGNYRTNNPDIKYAISPEERVEFL